ncbi:MAG: suppressor of fused domain protein, partial [Cellulomonas sp.]|nr:suppressor of fused domain protein [Cellulomonas sp.]
LADPDPIQGISVYARDEPMPHWHFVTYGFTDLVTKETQDPDASGYGFELTLRIARAPDDDAAPIWALDMLQNLGRYVFGTGNRFAPGHKLGLAGPIAQDHATAITAIVLADDPELGPIESEFGHARFLQIVGITDDEYLLVKMWSSAGLLEILREQLPLLVTDLARRSVLETPAILARVHARMAEEGVPIDEDGNTHQGG